MKIIADENIPYVKQAFSSLGEISTLSGRAITQDAVRDADILLVRSITKVNGQLLSGSKVKFIATATIGTDHIDLPFLETSKTGFASAQGSNANSVAEYIMAALLVLESRGKLSLRNLTLGVVGVGNVGSKVARKAEGLGIRVLRNDPPLKRKTGDSAYRELEELMQADVITLHVPLTKEGPDRTYHLFNEERLGRMKPGAVLFNSSRGSVVEGKALKKVLLSGRIPACLLDVWEGEPDIETELLKLVAIGTPHIAGYSFDGKVIGTEMIYNAACSYFGMKPSWRKETLMPAPALPVLKVPRSTDEGNKTLLETVRKVYDIESDDRRMRGILEVPDSERGKYFDRLRKEYPVRREFYNTKIETEDNELKGKLLAIGFKG